MEPITTLRMLLVDPLATFLLCGFYFSQYKKQNSHHEIVADESVWSVLEVIIRFETTPLASL